MNGIINRINGAWLHVKCMRYDFICKNIILLLCTVILFSSCKKNKTVQINLVKKTTNTTYDLRKIYFATDALGFAVGGRDYSTGIILKTVDGGENWNRILSGVGWQLRDVFFVNKDTGYVVGNRKTILKTVNGGDTWSSLIPELTNEANLSEFIDFTSIAFAESGNGIICGGTGFEEGIVLLSQNSGVAWQDITPDVCPDCLLFGNNKQLLNNSLQSVTFSGNSGYMAGYGMILKTVDGGISWKPLSFPNGGFFKSVFIPDKNEQRVLVAGFKGLIMETIDGGNNWAKLFDDKKIEYLESITGQDALYVVGLNIILFSEDKGLSWKYYENEYAFNDVVFHNNTYFISSDGGNIFKVE